MSEPTGQDTTDNLAERIAKAAISFHESGAISDPQDMLSDMENQYALDALISDGTDMEREYALTAMAFIKERASLMPTVESPRAVDSSYVAGPIPTDADELVEFMDMHNQPPGATEVEVSGRTHPVPNTQRDESIVSEIPAAPDEEEEVDPLVATLDAHVQRVLSWLHHTPVLLLGMKKPESAKVVVPSLGGKARITKAQAAVVQHVIAPVMRACGILAVELEPHVYDVVRGKSIELDMNDAKSARMWLRSITHHVNLDPEPPAR